MFGSMRVGITSVPDEEAMREEPEEEVIAKVINIIFSLSHLPSLMISRYPPPPKH